jgi:hypothetical protein
MKDKKIILVGISLCFIITVFHSGCVDNNQDNTNNNSLLMTYGQFIADYTIRIDNETRIVREYFQSLDAGDTVIIRDTINTLTYWESHAATQIDFASSYHKDNVSIRGDITGEYVGGDNVILELTITSDLFTREHNTTGEIWTYDLEMVNEMWDKEKRTSVAIPPYYLRHA